MAPDERTANGPSATTARVSARRTDASIQAMNTSTGPVDTSMNRRDRPDRGTATQPRV